MIGIIKIGLIFGIFEVNVLRNGLKFVAHVYQIVFFSKLLTIYSWGRVFNPLN